MSDDSGRTLRTVLLEALAYVVEVIAALLHH